MIKTAVTGVSCLALNIVLLKLSSWHRQQWLLTYTTVRVPSILAHMTNIHYKNQTLSKCHEKLMVF